MRSKFGLPNLTWLASSFAALVLVALAAGCDTGTAPPGAIQANKAQQEETVKKIETLANPTAKKSDPNAPKARFHGKPGAAGGN